jgi:uncharacterized OB-fold protein
MTATAVPAKPVPVPDEASAPFFDGALAGRLMLLRCLSCRTYMSPIAYVTSPLRVRCVACFSGDLEWAPSAGRAVLYSFALVHHGYDQAFAADVPYNIALVETSEGVRLTSQIVGCANDELTIGMPLEVVFERLSDTVALPKFKALR